MISHFARVCLFALACVAAVPAPSSARTPYDGAWSVLIVTQRGACDRAYRYGIQIVDGNLVYDGGIVSLTGRVNATGAVRVNVSAGGAQANGSGRLTQRNGRGNWSGRAGGDACSGYWEAERR
jgi:hypothetical protein